MSFFTEDFLGVDYFNKIEFDYVEFYSGNAKQSAYFYRNAFGFDLVAYKGPETTETDKVSYVLKKNKIVFVISSPLLPEDEITGWISKHGDSVYSIAFKVESVKDAYKGCLERGAISVSENTYKNNKEGIYEEASIKSYGDCIHTFVNRDNYKGVWAPGFISIDDTYKGNDTNLVFSICTF